MHIHRGCSAQYAGVLDSPWSNVVDALENLVTEHINSDAGIEKVIKQLDGKLSETIMRAMENGQKLEDMVSSSWQRYKRKAKRTQWNKCWSKCKKNAIRRMILYS